MATANRQMQKARQRLSRNLGEPTLNEALGVLDKAVTGLISLAKGKDVTDGASGKQIDSPFGKNTKNPYGTNDYDINIGSVGEDLETYKEQRNLKQKTAGRVRNTVPKQYDAGNSASALGFSMAKAGAYGDDLEAGWDDTEDQDDEDEDGDSGRREPQGRGNSWQMGRQAPRRRDDDDDDDDDDDARDDDEDDDEDDDDEEKGWGQSPMMRGYGEDMEMGYGDDDDDDDDDRDDDDEDDDDDDDRDDDDEDDDDDHDDSGEDDDWQNQSTNKKSFGKSWSVNDIHKALVAGPNGARVAEVVEASRELAHMVNVFGGIMADLSGQMTQIRNEQRNGTAVLADAVNTVVKSQSAIAIGLERMAKSAARLARNGGGELAKSYGTNSPSYPGVVMNGKVMAEGASLRRSNAMVDETGSAVVSAGTTENRLTKALVGNVIQQAVLDGEYSAKDALRWLTETDSPASGPVAVYRQLPAKLQDRIARRADDVQ